MKHCRQNTDSRLFSLPKTVCAAFALTLAIVIVFLTRTGVEGAVPNPLLYVNDKAWALEDKLPIEKVRGIYYVPASLFAQLDGYEIRVNTKQKTFIIEYDDGKKFLSFDTASGFAMNHNGVQIYIPTYEFHDERYVPAEELCKRLGLKLEQTVSSVTGEVALRVRDSSSVRDIVLLIYDNYPGFYSPETTVTTPITTAPITAAPPSTTADETSEPAPELTDRTIYITIEDSPGEYTEELLGLLDLYGCKATFFVVGDNVRSSPALLAKIASAGHAIGLHTMNHQKPDAATILEDIEAENELISGYIRKKSLIWRAPEGSYLSGINRALEMTLNNAGYLVWDWNIEPTGRTAAKKSESVIDGIWNHETAVIRITENKDAPEILKALLEFISAHSDVCEVRTISAAEYEMNQITK